MKIVRFALMLACVVSTHVMAQSVAVGDSGTPSYGQAVAVPPGIAGMVPNVSLLYSGVGVNGPLGAGWSLQGISSITRCPAIIGTDGRSRSVQYSSEDKLCLDGQRLIESDAGGLSLATQSGDSLGGSGLVREYRTEKDSFMRIRAYGSYGSVAANGPAYFKVWTKSGQIYEYGNNSNTTSNSVVTVGSTSPKAGVVATWLASRISDTLGNFIDFQYSQRDTAWGSGKTAGSPAAGHEWALSEIRYTGTASQPAANKVVFNYVDRPVQTGLQDGSEAYHVGNKNVSVWRLSSIQTQINITATPIDVKVYKLAYDNSPTTGKSRLISIQECANGVSSTICMPPTKFSYSTGSNGAFTKNAVFAGSSTSIDKLQTQAGDYGVFPIDVNGDGKTDFIRWADDPSKNMVYLSNGDGSFNAFYPLELGSDNLFKSDGCYFTLPVDINGDGLVDLFRYSKSTSVEGAACAQYGSNLIFINAGDGTFVRQTYTGPALTRTAAHLITTPKPLPDQDPVTKWSAGSTFYFSDLNSDGFADLIIAKTLAYTKDNGDPNPCDTNVCTFVYRGDGAGNFTAVTTNVAYKSLYTNPADITSSRYFFDVDGDGLVDIAGIPSSANAVPAYRSVGDFTFEPVTSEGTCTYPLDFNGDGRTDCLDWNTSAKTAALRVSTGTGLVSVADFNLGAANGVLGTANGLSFLDVQPDGRSEILAWFDDPTKNMVYLSNGTGTFLQAPGFNLNSTARQLAKSDGTYAFVTGDFTGHGGTEILRMKLAGLATTVGNETNSNELYVRTETPPPDLLLSMTGPTGLITSLNWESLAATTRYSSDRGGSKKAVYPQVDLTMPIWLVTSMQVDSGVGLQRVTTDFWYTGLKAAYDGRGTRGFRKTARQSLAPDGASKVAVETEYVQQHPYTGVAKTSQTTVGGYPNGSVVSRTTYTYCDMASGTDPTAATAELPCSTSALIQRPYVYKSVEEAFDHPSGAALPTVTTVNTYFKTGSQTGDVDTVKVTRSGYALGGQLAQTSTQTTKNEYLNNIDGDNWQLGRLTRSTQTNTVGNQLASVATSAGAAPNAAATKGTGTEPPGITLPPAPISNAVLSTIIDLILQD